MAEMVITLFVISANLLLYQQPTMGTASSTTPGGQLITKKFPTLMLGQEAPHSQALFTASPWSLTLARTIT